MESRTIELSKLITSCMILLTNVIEAIQGKLSKVVVLETITNQGYHSRALALEETMADNINHQRDFKDKVKGMRTGSRELIKQIKINIPITRLQHI